ncbi:MAG: hypothetical protein CMH54_07080 [Myxococcales bacterium]|nr:hypothetical protein [Myxococcales bacterium]
MESDIIVYNPTGDPIHYTVVGLPATAEAYPTNKGIRLRWAPIASEVEPGGRIYTVNITAQSVTGHRAEVEFTLIGYPDGGTPVFFAPHGVVLDLANEDRISILIEIKDDDSSELDFQILQDLPEASWSSIDDRTHTVTWVPTPAQIEEKTLWSLVLAVKDESHPLVTHTISVVLANSFQLRDCPGTWPIVKDLTANPDGLGNLSISVRADDPESEIGSVMATWVSYDLQGEQVISGVAPLSRQGDLYQSTITRQALGGMSAALANVSVQVRDDDDADSTLCDHETRIPKFGGRTVSLMPGSCPAQGQEAVSIESGEPLELLLCPGMDQQVEVPIGLDDAVSVVARTADPNLVRVDLYGANPGLVLASAEGTGTVPLVRSPMADPGPLRVVTSMPGGVAPGTVRLNLEITEDSCSEDSYEPDDTPGLSNPIGVVVQQQRTLCPGDEDYVRLDIESQSVLSVEADFDADEADIDLQILASDGVTVVRQASSRGKNETLQTNLPQGNYFLRVYSEGGRNSASYSLQIAVDTSGTCLDDLFAPNGSPNEAPLIPESYQPGLMLCKGTSDYFRHTINSQESYEFEAWNMEGLGVDIAILDTNGTEVSSGVGSITTQALIEGTYTLRVTGTATNTPYGMTFSVTNHSVGCPVDRFEPNHTVELAKLLPAGWTTRLLLCTGQMDYFALHVDEPTSLRLVAFYASSIETVKLEQIHADGSTLAVANNEGPRGVLETILPAPGVYLFRVSSDFPQTFYDLMVEFP